ncbi:MAG TPA: hypothetical protein PKI21_02475 [Nitrospira sp.]|jgi:hypothetical protein|nr:hypothetical protein [Nitrospira sp.]
MSDNDDSSFRVQARLNRVEYADLEEDLNRFPPGADRSGRIRLLMRLGLEVSKGRMPSFPAEEHAHPSAQVVDIHRGTRKKPDAAAPAAASPEPVPQSEPVDVLDSLGLDPTSFRFGTPS